MNAQKGRIAQKAAGNKVSLVPYNSIPKLGLYLPQHCLHLVSAVQIDMRR